MDVPIIVQTLSTARLNELHKKRNRTAMSSTLVNSARATSPAPGHRAAEANPSTSPSLLPVDDKYEKLSHPAGKELTVTLSKDGKEIALRTKSPNRSTSQLFLNIQLDLACSFFASAELGGNGESLVLKSLLGPNVSLVLSNGGGSPDDIRFYANEIAAKIGVQAAPARTRFVDLKEGHQKVLSFSSSWFSPKTWFQPTPSISEPESI